MKTRSTLFLKIAIFLMGIPVLALCIYLVSWLPNNPVNPDYSGMLYPVLVVIFVSAIPFYLALFKSYCLLNYIDKNQSFSQISINALKSIKYCAVTISFLYVVIMPFVYLIAEKDDAPGLIIMGMVPIFASLVIAVFAAVLLKLLQEAVYFKSENDLTV